MLKSKPSSSLYKVVAIVAGLWAGALAAQDTTTVGPPQLKNFQLPGQQTVVPSPTQPPAQRPAPPPASQSAPAPAPAQAAPPPAPAGNGATPATQPAARRPQPEAAAPAARRPTIAAPARPAAPLPRPAARPAATVRTAPPPQPVAQPIAPAAPIAVPARPAAPPPPAPQAAGSGPSILPWMIGLGGIVLLALLFWAWRRRGGVLAERDTEHRGALAGSLFAGGAPAPAEGVLELDTPAPAPAEAVAEPVLAAAAEAPAPRPWLELDIKPERAAATDAEAVVHYQLRVTNVGDAPARNIRIDTRMFNASETDRLTGFIEGPIHRHSGSPHVALPPGQSLELDAVAGMKKEEVREIELAGRRIFVPTVAVNVAYDWAESGEGRTSKSWVVGRESTETAKMGPFRLDLGPRIYRQVGRRDAQLVMV